MLNIQEFTKRIKKVMEYYNISASSFAEKIEVPRSSISHILSGRNKPSLEFILKITKEFKEVDLFWLLYNEGSFPKSNSPTPHNKETNLFTAQTENKRTTKTEPQNPHTVIQNNSNISKVLIFYNDGTFEEYKKKEQS